MIPARAPTLASIHPLLAERRSTRAFDPRPLPIDSHAVLAEAARWAPSAANEQPWRLVVVTREDASHAATVAALTGANPRWAVNAPVLVVMTARPAHTRNGNPNRYAWHDTGIATAMLVTQATALGLGSHVMAGFDAAAMRTALSLPAEVEPVTVIAIGTRAPADTLPEDLRERESAPRTRLPLEAIAFRGRYGTPLLEPKD